MMKSKVVLGIPTFKRPDGLHKLLISCSMLNVTADIELHIVVVDNDKSSSTTQTVINNAKDYLKYPISLQVESERGISSVRNKLLELAFDVGNADYLAMVDDDETVESEWISNLIQTHKSYNVDVVGGAILPEFSSSPPLWTKGLPIFWRKIPASGNVDLIHNTGSVLISRSSWIKFGKPKFDVEFGLTGGGDKEFFTRYKASGATFAFSAEALSYEYYDSERLTLDWAKKREYRIGSTDIRIKKKNGMSLFEKIKELGKFFGALMVYSFLFMLFFPNFNKRVLPLLKIHRQLGKINALYGTPYQEYKKTHGH